MYKVIENTLTNEQKGIILDLILFLREIPNIKVHLDDNEEFRIHYIGGHEHVSLKYNSFSNICETIQELIKNQIEYNNQEFIVYIQEELKAKNQNSSDIPFIEGKKNSILSQKTYDAYNNKIKEILANNYKD